MAISWADALRVAVAAFAEGERRGVKALSFVLTDAGGNVTLAVRGDGHGLFGINVATAKAVSALGFNRSTMALAMTLPAPTVVAVASATGGRFVALGGGVVAIDAAGVTVGAAAVSGGMPAVDHAIVVAALEACGFGTLP